MQQRFLLQIFCLLNMFRAPLCPSSGAQELILLVAACGISCCGFQVAVLVWSWGLCVRFAGCSNFLLSICLLIQSDTLLLVPSLHCNTSLHFTTLHQTTLHHTSPNYTSLHLSTIHFLSFTLHYPLIWFNLFTFPFVLFHPTVRDT